MRDGQLLEKGEIDKMCVGGSKQLGEAGELTLFFRATAAISLAWSCRAATMLSAPCVFPYPLHWLVR